jgi:protein O-GlcNAc transferase
MQTIEELNNLGINAYNAGKEEEAINYFNQALGLGVNIPSYYFLGLTYQNRSEFKTAIKYYQKALDINPDIVIVHNNLGVIYLEVGDLKKAGVHLSKALKLEPQNALVVSNIGNLLKTKGEYDRAIDYYKKAIKLNPQIPQVYYNLASVYFVKGDNDDALQYVKKTLEVYPDYPDALFQLGIIYKELKEHNIAKESFLYYLKLYPDDINARALLANIYFSLEEIEKAKKELDLVLDKDPNYAASLNDLGSYYKRKNKQKKAIRYYKKAVKVKPDFAEAHHNLGVTLDEVGEFEKAVVHLNKAIELSPSSSDTMSYLASTYMWQCDWKEFNVLAEKLNVLTPKEIKKGVTTSESPFINVVRWESPVINFGVAKSWGKKATESVEPLDISFIHNKRKRKKTSIGYLSSDFHDHATAHLIRGLFRLHDRKKFKIYALSNGRDDKSKYRKEIEKVSDIFLDIKDLPYQDAAKVIHDNKIDILVDLKGWTKGHSMEVCALRPAPVITHYLGFPGTTGADFIDYFITDHVVTPITQKKYYSEKLIYLPNCYQVNDNKEKISKTNMKRRDFGLPEKAVIFSSFNHNYKINENVFNTWAKILKRVDKSILWLLQSNPDAEKNIMREAKKLGIGKQVVFAHMIPKDVHLKRMQLSDIALDPYPCNGHTTTSDALWAGVPVVALLGKHFAGRVAASILTDVCLPELVTKTPKTYENLAVKLAKDKKMLEKIRVKLAKNRTTNPLFDTERFTGDLESAYEIMWDNYQKGKKPKEIIIK